jgi:hypothetical protein
MLFNHLTCFVKSELPPDAKPLCITLYADKTRLSSFGTAQGYPIMAQCANLPRVIRNGKGLGATQIVGWLPLVRFMYSLCDCSRHSQFTLIGFR